MRTHGKLADATNCSERVLAETKFVLSLVLPRAREPRHLGRRRSPMQVWFADESGADCFLASASASHSVTRPIWLRSGVTRGSRALCRDLPLSKLCQPRRNGRSRPLRGRNPRCKSHRRLGSPPILCLCLLQSCLSGDPNQCARSPVAGSIERAGGAIAPPPPVGRRVCQTDGQ